MWEDRSAVCLVNYALKPLRNNRQGGGREDRDGMCVCVMVWLCTAENSNCRCCCWLATLLCDSDMTLGVDDLPLQGRGGCAVAVSLSW